MKNRVTITLSLWSEVLHPSRVSEILGMEADRSVTRGRDRMPPRALPKGYGWHLFNVDFDVQNLNLSIMSLTSRFLPARTRFLNVRKEDKNISVILNVSIAPISAIPIYIEANVIDFLNNLGGDLNIEHFEL
jgi:hypothetical protein